MNRQGHPGGTKGVGSPNTRGPRSPLAPILAGYLIVVILGALLISPLGPGSSRILFVFLLVYSCVLVFLRSRAARSIGVVVGVASLIGIIQTTRAQNAFQRSLQEKRPQAWSISQGVDSEGNTSDNAAHPTNTLHRIAELAELPIPQQSELLEFLEKNPEYNPSWVAKVRLPSDSVAAANLKEEITSKPVLRSVTADPLTDSVSWWTPAEPLLTMKYMTSNNAVVNTELCDGNGGLVLYVYWICP